MDVCRVLDAWAAFDVFALAIVISHSEFGLFSKFLMERNNLANGCRFVKDVFHDRCFHMECELTPGFILLGSGGMASYAVPKLAFTICSESIRLRSEHSLEQE